MRAGVDYYSVLGVPRNVTPEELKRRYRQLVRQNHPDVALDQDAAHERFITIVEAYRTLSDPVRRRAYDALRASSPPPPPTRSAQIQRQIDDWFRHAVHRLEAGDLSGAAAQCHKILALDGRHAAAQALLGDVHARRGEWDQALTRYSGAVAAAPRSPAYARKLREAAEEGQRARIAAEKREHAAAQHRRAVEALNARHETAPYSTIVLVSWLGCLAAWCARDPGPRIADWFPLPLHLTLTAVAAGLLLGLLIGLLRVPRPAEHGSSEAVRGTLAAFGLGLVSLLSFYVSAAAYCVLALVRDRLTPSLTAAFLATFVCVAALAGLATLAPEPWDGLWRHTALWGGNLVFPTLLLGLALGRVGVRQVA